MLSEEATTPEQAAKITQLASAVEAAKIEVPWLAPATDGSVPKRRELLLKKFLIARQWDVAKALDMLKKTVGFRAAKGYAGMALFPSPADTVRGYDEADVNKVLGLPTRELGEVDRFVDAMHCTYGAVWYKWDKKKRPVFIERTGKIDTVRFVDVLKSVVKPGQDHKEPALNIHAFGNETGISLVQYQSLKYNDPLIQQVTIVLDVDGLSMASLHKPCLQVLEAMTAMDKEHYPEGLSKIFLVNCPTIISIVWGIVKIFIDERTRKKVIFCTPSETAAALLAEIDADCLPQYLGGTCKDLVPLPKGGVPTATADAAITQRIPVPSGQVLTKNFRMEKGQTVSWEFVTEENNISFGVKFGKSLVVVPNTKMQNCSKEPVRGSFVAPEDGHVELTFDNSYAWMKEKVVLLQLVLI